MHIFIDETGSFGGIGQFPSPSLVGALIVPSRRLSSLERAYTKLRPRLPTERGEVKGRLLDERQVASVVQCLKEHSVVFEAAGIELGAHTEAGLLAYQQRQANDMTTVVADRHPGWVRQRFENFRQEYEAFPLNLVVQSRLNFHLIRRVLEWDTMYFSQRRPEELGAYHWVIDAKGDTGTPTSWERWWSEFVMPVLQSGTIDQLIYMLPEGDYTHMRRFELELAPTLRRFRPDADSPAMNILMLLEDFRFSNQPEPGMELVDIVTNATRRAVKGNLRLDGYRDIPTLMLHRNQKTYIDILALEIDRETGRRVPYGDALDVFGQRGRLMSTSRTDNRLEKRERAKSHDR